MQRPLYMRPQDALEYGIIDEIIQPNADKQQKAVEYWVKSGRAESEGRLEQWQEYLALQEEYALKDSFKKVVGQVRGPGVDAVWACDSLVASSIHGCHISRHSVCPEWRTRCTCLLHAGAARELPGNRAESEQPAEAQGGH